MLCALIMAGGRGTRFWPLSTEEKPKQFLKLLGYKTMIQMTVNRIEPLIPLERIFISTGEKYVSLVKEQLPDLPERNIIIEPEARNTTPCIALSAFVIKRYYKDATMVVLPADHLIKNENKFEETISNASKFVDEHNTSIVTLGITPSRAETGYGYIKEGKHIISINNANIVKVDKFVEKPTEENAKEYLENGNYLWNAGMFIWKIDNIINLMKRYQTETFEVLKKIEIIEEEKLQKYINKNYLLTKKVSIDYGIMEKSDEIYVIPSDFGWDDVGSWESIERYREKDESGNIHIGKVKSNMSSNNIIITLNNEVIINNISNIYVIENNGKIIIGNKSEIKSIKQN
ncbi:mannose-1-phosphate guanylyltransferase (GDP) [Clostridium cavendishii DSM 21758]|uniref:mannose-1-phosphate guanylyltransferase n=1 Tax=Clostridium cavendishii DSM 21758 TaxID=1121302 RepID=A0A1M6QA79_9CLOT|nr:mannose-1-phosphate guanylyltransferase [Clostridium cavendishii]SHK17055.1 mannose-1-phosphate guanylyltransferase (GDP) [Clostridium cavendishii DSM 21758]